MSPAAVLGRRDVTGDPSGGDASMRATSVTPRGDAPADAIFIALHEAGRITTLTPGEVAGS
ncbi:hypothetical protein [Streptosporangium sp. NPDC000396]|uniref:hypothetical protein n=1 Tax=Streptosporangium sp. NPDC000396 TaxID=3366185 RepID=UPI0036A35BAB